MLDKSTYSASIFPANIGVLGELKINSITTLSTFLRATIYYLNYDFGFKDDLPFNRKAYYLGLSGIKGEAGLSLNVKILKDLYVSPNISLTADYLSDTSYVADKYNVSGTRSEIFSQDLGIQAGVNLTFMPFNKSSKKYRRKTH